MGLSNNIEVIVTQKRPLTVDVTLFRLESLTGVLPPFSAGSHVEVAIAPQLTRAYSLCNAPSDSPAYYEIAVKLEAGSRGGSLAMHQTIQVATALTISTPKNYFPLQDEAEHHLLIGAGIGLTPILSMAHFLSDQPSSFTLYACASEEKNLPFLEVLDLSNWALYKHVSGRKNFDITSLLSELPKGLHVYCCGPNGFIDMVRQQCESLLEGHFHEERFSSISDELNTEVNLYLSESDIHISVPTGSNMFKAIKEAGIEVDSVCEQGICGSCVVPWKDGDPIHNDECLELEERNEYLALCCAGCQSSSLTLEL